MVVVSLTMVGNGGRHRIALSAENIRQRRKPSLSVQLKRPCSYGDERIQPKEENDKLYAES